MNFLICCARMIDRLNRSVGRVVIWLTLVMIVIGFLNAGARYIGRGLGMNLTWTGALEAQWYLFSIVFLFLGAYALQRDSHVRVDVVFSNLSSRTRCWIDVLGTLLFLIPFCALTVYLSWPFVVNSIRVFEISPDPGGLPRWPIKLAIPIAFALLLLQAVAFLIDRVAFLSGRGPDPYQGAETTAGEL